MFDKFVLITKYDLLLLNCLKIIDKLTWLLVIGGTSKEIEVKLVENHIVQHYQVCIYYCVYYRFLILFEFKTLSFKYISNQKCILSSIIESFPFLYKHIVLSVSIWDTYLFTFWKYFYHLYTFINSTSCSLNFIKTIQPDYCICFLYRLKMVEHNQVHPSTRYRV